MPTVVRKKSAFRGAIRLFVATWVVGCLSIVGSPAKAEDAPRPETPVLKQGNGRIVFVGDSITGLGRNYATGFAHQIEWALKAVYPDCHPDLVNLGGSGQGVTSWLNTEKRSRTEEFFLDVKGVPVRASLDQPADALVIMLGMNDVLAPYVADTFESREQWAVNYRELVLALKNRVHPKVIALATVTMCTEDPGSPKNVMIGKLNDRVRKLTLDLDCRIAVTGESMQFALQEGRKRKPDFHVTYDFVHPNEAGHLALAIAMLLGLREERAVARLHDARVTALLRRTTGDGPSLSYECIPLPGPRDSDRQNFRLRYGWAGNADGNGTSKALLRYQVRGAGWDVPPSQWDGLQGEFVITGNPEHRENLLTLEGRDGDTSLSVPVKISPPWLVALGPVQPYWSQLKFDPSKATTSFDEQIARGADVTTISETASGQPLRWTRYYPSVNYTGLDSPGSVDFAAIVHTRNFETGYAARWIHSPQEREAQLKLGTQAFAGAQYLTVFLNGAQVYRGQITDEPRRQKQLGVRLREGWNALVVKTNHCTWQWQFSADLAPKPGETLDDLRYSTVAPR